MERNLKERLAMPHSAYFSKQGESRRQNLVKPAKQRDFNLQELAMLSFSPLVRTLHNWWLHRAERHYLICADVEQQRAREAQANAAYYQKRAALARSARQ